MAIQKTVMTKFGFEVEDAYHRIAQIYIEPKNKIRFVLKSYKDTNFQPFDEAQYFCDYDPSGSNVHAQAYAYLKTTEDFFNAKDC